MSIRCWKAARLAFNSISKKTLGPCTVENTMIGVPVQGETREMLRERRSTESRIKRRRSKLDGILGYDVLRHVTMTIDYQERTLQAVGAE